ncbi:MAG: hypothetical protein ABJV04_15990 [Aliiglaciecola sp.]|uniref:hypothetical protein n=1 Tax=Aliiglaciecola sp. TaxID=1872441 RepID=UPI003298C66F
MNLQFKLILSTLTIILVSGCISYGTEDYGEYGLKRKASLCVNMNPAQEKKCKDREYKLSIGLGADENCHHSYEYEKNRCKIEQAKKQKALDESLKKHTVKNSV